MGNLRRAILVVTTGIMLTASWGASWSESNVGLPGIGVGVNSLAIDPASPSTIYALTQTAGGPPSVPGLFKTTDGGGSWKAVSSVIGVTALVIDPKNSSTIYAGTNQGVVKSTNGGESWTDASNGLANGSVSRLIIDPITPSTLYAISINTGPSLGPSASPGAAIFKSSDGGGSWNALDTGLPPNARITLLVIDPASPSILYALAPPFPGPPGIGGPPAGGLLKSTDGGQSWNALNTGLPPPTIVNSLAIDPITSSTIYGVTNRGLFKSTDGGARWNALNTGLPPNSGITSLTIAPTTPSIIYAVVFVPGPTGPASARIGILKSTDGGDHWNIFDISLPANTSLSSLALDPITPSRIYAGAVGLFVGGVGGPFTSAPGGVFKSTDGGQSWNASSAGLITFDVRTLAGNSVDASTIHAGGFGGVFTSTDGGANWNGAGLSAFTGFLVADVVNANILYAQTGRSSGCRDEERVLLRSSDGGVSWSDTISPLNSGCILSVSIPFAHVAPLTVDPTDPNTLYLGESDDQDGYSALLKSTDGGARWTAAWDSFTGLRSGVRALAIDPTHPATLYAGLDDVSAESSGLFKSTDGGASWSNTGLTASAVNLLAIGPSNAKIIYAGTEGHNSEPRGFQGLFKSTDGGISWLAINKGLAVLIGTRLTTTTALIVDPVNSNIVYLGTSNGGVFRSADAGANWSPFNDGLTNLQIRALAVAAGPRHTVYAGTAGGVFKIFDE